MIPSDPFVIGLAIALAVLAVIVLIQMIAIVRLAAFAKAQVGLNDTLNKTNQLNAKTIDRIQETLALQRLSIDAHTRTLDAHAESIRLARRA